jgi:hypothetical protein
MAYIGKQPLVGNYQTLDALVATTTDTYALTKDTVAVFPQTPANCIVSLNGVIQAPFDSYTISGSDIVFDSALTGSDSIDFITVLGDVLNIGVPSDDTVTTAKLADSSVTTAKIATDAVTEAKIADGAVESEHLNNNIISGQTELATTPEDTDEFLVSDAGTLKRIDYTHIKGLADTNQAIVKGWVNFNGTGVVAINQSYNCTSVTDNKTGSYSVNWSGATGATGSNHASAGGGDLTGYNDDERVQVYNGGNNQTGVESWNGTTATDFNPLHCLTFGNGS